MSVRGSRQARAGLAAARYAAMLAIAIVLVSPLMWLFVSSFRPAAEIFAGSHRFGWHTFIPDRLTFENYTGLLGTLFPRAVLNSLVVAGSTMVLGVLINAAAGFAFAVFRFPFRDALFVLVLASSMMPFEAIVIPLYLLVRGVGLVDTYAALILPELANGFAVFLFRQFFAGIPREFYEAARVDGATWNRIFWRIALPLSWPVVVTAAMMLFITQWEAFFWPLIAAPSTERTLIQVAIARNVSLEEAAWGRLFSSTTIACLLALVPFLLFQRAYLRNVASSGLK